MDAQAISKHSQCSPLCIIGGISNQQNQQHENDIHKNLSPNFMCKLLQNAIKTSTFCRLHSSNVLAEKEAKSFAIACYNIKKFNLFVRQCTKNHAQILETTKMKIVFLTFEICKNFSAAKDCPKMTFFQIFFATSTINVHLKVKKFAQIWKCCVVCCNSKKIMHNSFLLKLTFNWFCFFGNVWQLFYTWNAKNSQTNTQKNLNYEFCQFIIFFDTIVLVIKLQKSYIEYWTHITLKWN